MIIPCLLPDRHVEPILTLPWLGTFDKNQWLKENRSISVEEVIAAMKKGDLLDVVPHALFFINLGALL